MGRRAFAAEFKREAVKAVLQPGVSRAQVAAIGDEPEQVKRVRRLAGAGDGPLKKSNKFLRKSPIWVKG